MGRRWAREKAFQLLYQLDIRPEGRREQIEVFCRLLGPGEEEGSEPFLFVGRGDGQSEDLLYIREVVEGVLDECPTLDERIQNYLKDWSLARLPRVDRALLRLGAYEILHLPGVPKSVSINEIVLLAKAFAADESRSYINGVLARFEKESSAEATDEALTEAVDGALPEALAATDAEPKALPGT